MDDDGFGGDKLPLAATVTVKGDHMHLDFTDRPSIARRLQHHADGVMATVAYAIKALLDPELPANSGLFDAIEFTAPEGTIVNPHYPAAVGARTTTPYLRRRVRSLCGLLPPEKAMASCHDVLGAMVFSGKSKKHDGTYVIWERSPAGTVRGFFRRNGRCPLPHHELAQHAGGSGRTRIPVDG